MPSQVGNSSLQISRLYNLEPIGLGTPYVESLTSYIARLAEGHCVTSGTLVAKEIIPLINKPYMIKGATQGGSMFYYSSATINGVGNLSADFLDALKALTLREDIFYTTMQTWRDILPTRGLFHSTRAWCPLCLEELMSGSKVIYEPLIWCFKVITMCPVHLTELVFTCPHHGCNKPNLVLNRKSRPGYCSQCGEWLGMSDSNLNNKVPDISVDHLRWCSWTTESLGELLAIAPKLNSHPLKHKMFANINTLVRIGCSGSIAAFSRLIGTSKSSLSEWCSGSKVPSINSLLRICYYSGVKLKDLVAEDELVLGSLSLSILPAERSSKKQARISFDCQLVSRQLEEILLSGETPPPSMREVARRLGYDQKMLYRHLGETCKRISAKHMGHKRKLREQKENKSCIHVQKITYQLIRKGIYPSRRKVEALSDQPALLRKAAIQRAWKETVNNNLLKPIDKSP